MTPQVYENIEQLTYGELIVAIENIKSKLYDALNTDYHADFQYYIALLQEFDKRQRD